MPITMQQKLDFTRPAMVMYSIERKHNDKQLQWNKDQVGRSYEAKQIILSRCEDKKIKQACNGFTMSNSKRRK